MSIVGTRPPLPNEWEAYELHHRARLAIKPGITGMWQVSGRSEITDFEEVVKLDTKYINEWSLGLDIKILFKTVMVVLKKEIVHVHNTLNLVSPAVYYAARRMKVPVVQTIHNFRLLCPGATFYRDGHICEDCVEHGLGCAVKHSCYTFSLTSSRQESYRFAMIAWLFFLNFFRSLTTMDPKKVSPSFKVGS